MREVQQRRWSALTTSQAFVLHLALSLLIFSSLIYVMALYWFPGELFFMDGGYEGIKLVAMVDLVLGPLLTLLLFKRGKPSLVFDLSVVACLQIAALAYGFYATYNQRIVAYVYAENRFNTLTIAEHRESNERLIAKGVEPVAIKKFGDQFPVSVYTRAFDKETYGEYLESIFNDFPAARERSDQYLDLQQHHDALAQRQLTPQELEQAGKLELVESLIQSEDYTIEEVEFYPLKARYESGLAVFDPKLKRVTDVLRHPDLREIEINRVATTEEANEAN